MVFLPSQQLDLDARAISGITGSISIACWVVVFSPQIISNFQRRSADGLSLAFLIVWLAGDVFNVLGAVMQGVLPTMIILAVYYTLADIILLLQCLYYRRLASAVPTAIDGSHLSPATPLLSPDQKAASPPIRAPSLLTTILFNTFSLVTVSLAGILGWYLTSPRHTQTPPPTLEGPEITFSPLGQLFGYLCALLYLASRVPQILLNFRRRSCEGISLLFFLFACMGNLTFVLSILAYVPRATGDEGSAEWWKYIAVNASWLVGSVGTLVLDLGIFVQFFWYRDIEKEVACDSDSDGDCDVGVVVE